MSTPDLPKSGEQPGNRRLQVVGIVPKTPDKPSHRAALQKLARQLGTSPKPN